MRTEPIRPHPLVTGDEAIDRLLARLDDLGDRAAAGTVGVSRFLTPREAKYAARHLSARRAAGTAVLWGGYPGAERVRAFLLPDYCEGLLVPDALAASPVDALREQGLDDIADAVAGATVSVTVKGSGYRTLTHRDYLGSLLGLGVERDAVGDILTLGEHEAIVLTSEGMAAFFTADLRKVATDTVRVTRTPSDTPLSATRRLTPIHDTVASPRLDCVVAALCNLSREAAQETIRRGLVELDYEPCDACDTTVEPPAILSVRGHGKFAVEAFDGETRKGRMRLRAGQYR